MLKKYPELYTGPGTFVCGGQFEFEDGWLQSIDELSQRIMALLTVLRAQAPKLEIKCAQTKEKLGCLRWYPGVRNAEELSAPTYWLIRAVIAQAVQDAEWRCEMCGTGAHVVKLNDGLKKSICPDCRPLWENRIQYWDTKIKNYKFPIKKKAKKNI